MPCNPNQILHNSADTASFALNLTPYDRKAAMRILLQALVATVLLALPASAQCYADYRAQQGSPVRFHYGVAELPASACGTIQAAESQLRPRLQQHGWILVDVLSTFGPEGLDSRRERAGQFHLRF